MQKITVEYLLCEKQLARLGRITEKYNSLGLNVGIEQIFGMIMQCGSENEIDIRLQQHENVLFESVA